MTLVSGSLFGYPDWVQVFVDRDRRFIRLMNVTPEQAKSFGVPFIKGRYDNTGFAKIARVPLTQEFAQSYARTFDPTPDNYAAYGAAKNIGKEAFFEMEAQGWNPVLPDPTVLQERLPDIDLSSGFEAKLRSVPSTDEKSLSQSFGNEGPPSHNGNTSNTQTSSQGAFLVGAAIVGVLLLK